MESSLQKNKSFLELKSVLRKKSNLDASCILHQSLTLIADKWSLLILMALMQGTKRNIELRKQINGISSKMLAQSLKTLMSYGMVDRKAYPVVPPRVEYFLTDFGISTAGPLAALLAWSVEWENKITPLFNNRKK